MDKRHLAQIALPRPSINLIDHYITKWNNQPNYLAQEHALEKLFCTYKENKSLDEILIKVCAVNAFYSTHIFGLYQVAENILKLEIDNNLEKNNIEFVDVLSSSYKKSIYSFATKYCSWHKQNIYPIYDKYVVKMLTAYKIADGFSEFATNDLRTYSTFCKVYNDFINFYDLGKYDYKALDKFLWQTGKEIFGEYNDK